MQVLTFPGQGSQHRGMGKELFPKYESLCQKASDILGYDIIELCLNDSKRQLGNTQFTQPALYIVNSLRFYELGQKNFDCFIGHSLGEYNALHAAGAFDFETGLHLVKKRGELMAAASGGGMAAVLGVDIDGVKIFLQDHQFSGVDIANINTPTQLVISGQKEDINQVINIMTKAEIKVVPLFVSAPFHSRYMSSAAIEFTHFLKNFHISPLSTQVISNVTARPHAHPDSIKLLLGQQIEKPVQWVDSIRYLKGQGTTKFQEIHGEMLMKMINEIVEKCDPIIEINASPESNLAAVSHVVSQTTQHSTTSKPLSSSFIPSFSASNLGCEQFRKHYNVKYSYVAGAMYKGVASKELVIKMARARLLSFLGTGGRSLDAIKSDIIFIQQQLNDGQTYGVNLLYHLTDPDFELATVKLYLSLGVKNIETAAYMQVTVPLVLYRLSGLKRNADNTITSEHNIMAKVSRPEVAEAFMRPAPERLVNRLLDEKLITREQADLSQKIPMADDICVEADSGGHTDSGVATAILPSIQALKKEINKVYQYPNAIRIGLAGGVGTPQAAASAFIMGVDFVLTGSINQCSVEAGTSDEVKDLLQDIDVQDTDYAPAGDMFEIGAKIQVLKKGVLFSARANKLYKLYEQYNSLTDIPHDVIKRLEKSTFNKSIDEVWQETKSYLEAKGRQDDVERAELNGKHKMALVFRWYFSHSTKLALSGDVSQRLNFQIHTGPALGAFNQWVKGTELENWRKREVDRIAELMMQETASYLQLTMKKLSA